ncbi:MAG TPA: recombinase RecA, partial [Solirubrobacteraceae bacterium]|nr:recombinase RecA [Solirubrobacteraceae bacterium]
STAGCLIDLGIEHNVVTKSGSFFSYGDERLGQGRNNAKAFLDEHVEVAKEIEAKIYDALEIDRDLVQPIDPDAEASSDSVPGVDVAPAPVEQAA